MRLWSELFRVTDRDEQKLRDIENEFLAVFLVRLRSRESYRKISNLISRMTTHKLKRIPSPLWQTTDET